MKLEQYLETLPAHLRDLKINLASVLTPEGAPGLTREQIYGIAVSSAHSLKRELPPDFWSAIQDDAASILSQEELTAAHAAANLMGMTNVYYKTMSLIDDSEIAARPARLRMQFMQNPGVPKMNFELYSLAVSAISGCASCLKAHKETALKHEVSREAIHSTIRIASVIHAVTSV